MAFPPAAAGATLNINVVNKAISLRADRWTGSRHVIYGHTPRPHPVLHANATGLDTGCVYGYTLTGISLPDFKVYKVAARRAYFED